MVIQMKTIDAYETSDGKLFDSEVKAKEYEDDLLGQELDGLLKLFNFGGQLTRIDEYNGLMRLMNNRKALHSALVSIVNILEFNDET